MSASLVGSEMCIRDSADAVVVVVVVVDDVVAVLLLVLVVVVALLLILPVSYTHLTLPTICSV
eukprot:12990678-Alexandrium_andersonii.AAC.1